MTAIMRIDSHAPCVNFALMVTTRTTPVVTAPTMLITIERCQPFAASGPRCFSFNQWRTMPVCDSVNEVNTPTT